MSQRPRSPSPPAPEKTGGEDISDRWATMVVSRLKRFRKRRRLQWDQAIRQFAKKTGMSEDTIVAIRLGRTPTSFELRRVADAFGWSLVWACGVPDEVYSTAETTFFKELEVGRPSAADRIAFRRLYEECLFEIAKDVKREDASRM